MTIDVDAAEVEAFCNALVEVMLAEPPYGGEKACRLLDSVGAEFGRDLPDDVDALVAELTRRVRRPVALVAVMASIMCQVIRGAQAAGVEVHLERIHSPYCDLLELG